MNQQINAIKQDTTAKECIPKMGGRLTEVLSMPAICIILAYMLRMNELNEYLQEDLETILSKSTFLVDMMIGVTQRMHMEFMMSKGRSSKKVTARTVLNLIAFS